jgi:hypothetical protein
MSTPKNGRRETTPRHNVSRQLTIGECIAIGRYVGPLYDARGKLTVPLWAVLEYLDTLQVCTTCGYVQGEHRVLGDRKTCRHFSRQF